MNKLIQYASDTFKINISTLLNIYNLFDIPNIERYLKSIGYHDELNLECYIKPYHQSELNVKNLSNNLLDLAIERNGNKRLIKYLTQVKEENKDNFLLKEFIRKTKIYDIQRNQSYEILDTNIVKLIGENIDR